MPTHDETRAFIRDYVRLTHQQQDRFDRRREEFIEDLLAMEKDPRKRFQASLRVKKVQGQPGLFEMTCFHCASTISMARSVQGQPGLFEMTWAADGRATFSMGRPVVEGKRHIVWHRVGDHGILP